MVKPGLRDCLVHYIDFVVVNMAEIRCGLLQNGFRAVISTEIADIFRANALKNGLLPLLVPPAVHARLVAAGSGSLRIDVACC